MAAQNWFTGPGGSVGRKFKKTITVADKTWLGSNGRAAARRQQDSSDSNGSGVNMNLWQMVRQDGSNSCDSTVMEKTWLVSSVSNSNVSSKTAEKMAAKLDLQDLAVVAAKRRQQCQYKNNSDRENLAWQQWQGGGEATARR